MQNKDTSFLFSYKLFLVPGLKTSTTHNFICTHYSLAILGICWLNPQNLRTDSKVDYIKSTWWQHRVYCVVSGQITPPAVDYFILSMWL